MNNKNNTNLITLLQIAKKVDFGLINNPQNKLDMHENLLVNFSRSFKSKFQDSYHLFTNVYFFDYDILDIDPNSLIERAARTLGYQKYFIIIVYPQYGEIKTETISSESFPNCEMIIIHTSFEDLFNSGLMNKIYLENDNSTLAFKTIFNFRGWTYSALQTMFRVQNIILSGSKTQTRHILSPSTHRFSQFISVFESFNLNGVINSFHNIKPFPIKSGSFIKAALGPKKYKSNQSIGDISTKAFDLRWRAIFKEYFNKELPIREKKSNDLILAKKIGTNVSANSQNNTNTNNSQINIGSNLIKDSSKGQKDFDFENDPWIDDELKNTLYKMSPAYAEKVEEAMNIKLQNMKADLAEFRAEDIKNREAINKKAELKQEQEEANNYFKSRLADVDVQKANDSSLKQEILNNKKIENYLLKIVRHLILQGKSSSSKKGVNKVIKKTEIESVKANLLTATPKESLLNEIFPKIFKEYFFKPFGTFKRITKDNVLEFKKLLLNEHFILQKIASRELFLKKENARARVEYQQAEIIAENERISNFKIAYPGIAENQIPSHAIPNPLNLEIGRKLINEKLILANAEKERLASILNADELKAKRIEEIKEILDTSTIKAIYLPDSERDELERELKRLTKQDKNNQSTNQSAKRSYSTSATKLILFKRSYHTSQQRTQKKKEE